MSFHASIRTFKPVAILLIIGVVLSGCSDPSDSPDSAEPSRETKAEHLIDSLFVAHGSERVRHATISFDFRGSTYRAERNGWDFRYTRSYSDERGEIVDTYGNAGLGRKINGLPVPLTDRDKSSIRGNLNSVVYFALLPYSLKDPGVIAKYLGQSEVENQPYHLLEVTFTPDEGGDDWEDRFVYWIHPETFTMDYFAYRYFTSGGGARFRKAFNVRNVNGIIFSDYYNYTHPHILDEIELFGETAGSGELELFSEIVIGNITVEIHSNEARTEE